MTTDLAPTVNAADLDGGEGGSLRAVDRTLAVLLAFSREAPALGVGELSERLGLPKSVIHRILRSLIAHGMVTQDPETRAYALGYRVLALAASVPGEVSLREICEPHMAWLRAMTQETVGLHVVAGDVRMCLSEMESPHLLRMAAGVGRCFPLDRGAASRALLADGPGASPEASAAWRLATARLSAASVQRMEEAVAALNALGYSVSRGETVEGSASIATPLRASPGGPVVAALSVAGPASRFNDKLVQRHAPSLLEAAGRITRDLAALGGRLVGAR